MWNQRRKHLVYNYYFYFTESEHIFYRFYMNVFTVVSHWLCCFKVPLDRLINKLNGLTAFKHLIHWKRLKSKTTESLGSHLKQTDPKIQICFICPHWPKPSLASDHLVHSIYTTKECLLQAWLAGCFIDRVSFCPSAGFALKVENVDESLLVRLKGESARLRWSGLSAGSRLFSN